MTQISASHVTSPFSLASRGCKPFTHLCQAVRGQLAFRQGSYADALTYCLTAEKHLPAGFNQLRKDLAQGFYRISGKFIWPDDGANAVYSADGEQAITYALALETAQSDYYYRFAVLCVLSDKLEKGIIACHQAITLNPKYAYPYDLLGQAYYRQGRYDEAIIADNQAIAIDPKYATPHNNLGDVYWAQGRFEEAIAAYQKAIAIDPNRGNFNSLGWMYVVVEDYNNAQESLEKAIEEADWANLFNYGLLWALQGNWETAQENWQQGYQLCQQDDSPEAVKAFYCITLGEADKGLAVVF